MDFDFAGTHDGLEPDYVAAPLSFDPPAVSDELLGFESLNNSDIHDILHPNHLHINYFPAALAQDQDSFSVELPTDLHYSTADADAADTATAPSGSNSDSANSDSPNSSRPTLGLSFSLEYVDPTHINVRMVGPPNPLGLGQPPTVYEAGHTGREMAYPPHLHGTGNLPVGPISFTMNMDTRAIDKVTVPTPITPAAAANKPTTAGPAVGHMFLPEVALEAAARSKMAKHYEDNKKRSRKQEQVLKSRRRLHWRFLHYKDADMKIGMRHAMAVTIGDTDEVATRPHRQSRAANSAEAVKTEPISPEVKSAVLAAVASAIKAPSDPSTAAPVAAAPERNTRPSQSRRGSDLSVRRRSVGVQKDISRRRVSRSPPADNQSPPASPADSLDGSTDPTSPEPAIVDGAKPTTADVVGDAVVDHESETGGMVVVEAVSSVSAAPALPDLDELNLTNMGTGDVCEQINRARSEVSLAAVAALGPIAEYHGKEIPELTAGSPQFVNLANWELPVMDAHALRTLGSPAALAHWARQVRATLGDEILLLQGPDGSPLSFLQSMALNPVLVSACALRDNCRGKILCKLCRQPQKSIYHLAAHYDQHGARGEELSADKIAHKCMHASCPRTVLGFEAVSGLNRHLRQAHGMHCLFCKGCGSRSMSGQCSSCGDAENMHHFVGSYHCPAS